MKKQNLITKIIFKIIVYAALIAMTVSILVPVAWVFMASFKRNAEFIGQGTNPWALPEQLQYQNYITAFVDAEMGKYFLNSVIVTALSLALLLVIALPAAYALSRFDFKGKKILNIAFMAGLFVNINYIVVPIFLMLSDANKALGVEFFLDNRFILSVIYASSSLSFSIYLLSGYFKTLPKGFEEAAYIDGAGKLQVFMKITMPLIKETMIYLTITSIIGGMQIFDVPANLTNVYGDPQKAILTSSMYIYVQAFKNFSFGYASAASVLQFIIIAVLSFTTLKFMQRGRK